MELSEREVALVSAKVGVVPLPRSTTAHTVLRHHFGNHTFYLGPTGAFVWERAGKSTTAPVELRAFRIASWADDQRTRLQKQPPAPMGKSVVLE